MKAFVTGGTGFIGSHLIDSLLKHNIKIYALIRDLNNLKWLKGLPIHPLKGDLLTIPSLPTDIDYIFHNAGFTKASKAADYYTANQEGTASLFQALLSQKLSPKRVIYLSSLAAVGPSRHGNQVDEASIPCPVTPYGESKLQGEVEALKFKDKFPITIIRVGPVFGPRDRDFISYFRLINKGILPAFGSIKSRMSVCYVKDLIKSLKLCLDKDLKSGEILHIADPKPYSWDEIGRTAAQLLGKKLTRIKIPLPIIYLTALLSELAGKLINKPTIINRHKLKEMQQEAWITDTAKATGKLDFQSDYSLQAALQETLDWYIEQEWL